MPLFLVVYNQKTGAVRVDEYADEDRDAALARRFELEREHRLEPEIEVVLLGARSRDVLEQTHARYFRPVEELIRSA
jgi:hypothetical protein